MEQASSHLNSANNNPPSSSVEGVNTGLPGFTPVTADSTPPSFMGDFAEATHDLLMDDSAPKRAAAAHRLAGLRKPLASPYLIAALSDNSWEVRQAAVEALGQIGESEAIAPLQDLLDRGNQDALLQRAISRAIQSISERIASCSVDGFTIEATPKGYSPAIQNVIQPNGDPKQPAREVERLRSEAQEDQRADDEKKGLAAIEANRNRAEVESRQRIEREKQLAAEIELLRKAEADQLKRIQQATAESRRRAEQEARQRLGERASEAQVENEMRRIAEERDIIL